MQAYIVRRLLLFIPTIWVVTLVIFIILRLLPGDVALVILASEGDVGVDPEQYAELRHELGLDRPLYDQYINWLWGLFRLDWGTSLFSGQPVSKEVAAGLPVTVELAILSGFAAILIAIPIGVISAVRQDSIWDYALRTFAISGMAMPVFWTGTLIILLLVIFFRWLPPLQFTSFFEDPVTNLQQMVLPTITLAHFQAALLSRMTRSAMLEVLRQDYIRTAWSKGLFPRTVLLRHALRNALLPVVTLVGLQFGRQLGGTVIVESIFVLPGVGFRLVDAVLNRDWVLVQTLITLFAFSFMLINLLVDLIYAWLDPRIRYGT
jgi:peptide/nickel transport system permease protein